jgi:hypothetical protein
MADALERAALEGRLTSLHIDEDEDERERQRRRSRSSSQDEDELTSSEAPPTPPNPNHRGPQTGPKGVLADWKAASRRLSQQQHPNEKRAVPSSSGEESDDAEAVAAWREKRLAELKGSAERRETATSKTFGHLREIGVDQFETAVLGENEDVKVVLHLYEPVRPLFFLNTFLSSFVH